MNNHISVFYQSSSFSQAQNEERSSWNQNIQLRSRPRLRCFHSVQGEQLPAIIFENKKIQIFRSTSALSSAWTPWRAWSCATKTEIVRKRGRAILRWAGADELFHLQSATSLFQDYCQFLKIVVLVLIKTVSVMILEIPLLYIYKGSPYFCNSVENIIVLQKNSLSSKLWWPMVSSLTQPQSPPQSNQNTVNNLNPGRLWQD